MKEYFENEIKPLNDQLGRKLRVRTVRLLPVTKIPSEYKINVKITYTSYTGNRVTRIAGRKGIYEVLGLMI